MKIKLWFWILHPVQRRPSAPRVFTIIRGYVWACAVCWVVRLDRSKLWLVRLQCVQLMPPCANHRPTSCFFMEVWSTTADNCSSLKGITLHLTEKGNLFLLKFYASSFFYQWLVLHSYPTVAQRRLCLSLPLQLSVWLNSCTAFLFSMYNMFVRWVFCIIILTLWLNMSLSFHVIG